MGRYTQGIILHTNVGLRYAVQTTWRKHSVSEVAPQDNNTDCCETALTAAPQNTMSRVPQKQ